MSCRQIPTFAPFRAPIALVCLSLSAPSRADCPLAGSGTEGSPYAVATYGNLEQVGTSCDLAASYRLTSDIDASPSKLLPRGFAPIGRGSVSAGTYDPFTGAFHGAGHVIRDLFIRDSSDESVGLFGYVAGARIDSLGLIDAEISGIVKGGATGTTTGRPGLGGGDSLPKQTVVGAIAGTTDDATSIEVVLVSGSVTGTPAGGIVGVNGGVARNVHSACRVASNGYAGGIAGRNDGTIAQSYATGAVSGGDTAVGGVAADGGGIAGVQTGAVEHVYWNVPTTGASTAFGVDFSGATSFAGLAAGQAADSASYAGFGFASDSAWSILQGKSGPVLRIFAAAITGIRPTGAPSSSIRLRRADGRTEIVLPYPALVRVVDASGRQVLAETEFSAGTRFLALPARRSMLFVQVRSGSSTTTLPLEAVR